MEMLLDEVRNNLIRCPYLDILPKTGRNPGRYYQYYVDNRIQILNALLINVVYTNAVEYFGFGSRSGFEKFYRYYVNQEYYNSICKRSKYINKSNSGYNTQLKLLSQGTHNFKNLIYDEDGKSIRHKLRNIQYIAEGKLNLINYKYDYRSKINEVNLKRYGCLNPAWSYWKRTEYNQDVNSIHYVSDGRILLHNIGIYEKSHKLFIINCLDNNSGSTRYGFHSYPENELSKLLIRLSLDYEREVPIDNWYGTKFRIDYHILDLDVYLEVDGWYKYECINGNFELIKYHKLRNDYIESKLGKPLIHIMAEDVSYYKTHIKEFYNLLITPKYPISKIY